MLLYFWSLQKRNEAFMKNWNSCEFQYLNNLKDSRFHFCWKEWIISYFDWALTKIIRNEFGLLFDQNLWEIIWLLKHKFFKWVIETVLFDRINLEYVCERIWNEWFLQLCWTSWNKNNTHNMTSYFSGAKREWSHLSFGMKREKQLEKNLKNWFRVN
jgi:hypothetical protein